MIRSLVVAVLLGTSFLSAQSNPTSAAETPAPSTTKPTIPDSTSLKLIRGDKAKYPDAAKAKKLQGQVWLRLIISETGAVEDVEVLSGDPLLVEAAVKAAKTWVFEPFIRDGQPVKISHKFPVDFAFRQNVKDIAPPSRSSGVSEGNGETKTEVPEDVSKGYLLHTVSPVYPDHARQNGIQGRVLLRAVIDRSGRVSNVEGISGPKELVDAAVNAVQQWRYRPYMVNGEPIEIKTKVTLNFTLV